jgi:hypothetical protein
MTSISNYAKNRLANFFLNEAGNMTVVGIFGVIAIAASGSFALDVTNAITSRTHLQTAADSAAHAALYNRHIMNEDDAKVEALKIANATLPASANGQAILLEDIEFGRLDSNTGEFIAEPGLKNAVRVMATLNGDRDNALPTYLMKFLGVTNFDLAAQSIYTSYRPGCLREGFVAQNVVDVQSNNTFSNGFCIHSNTYVKLSNNNTFEPGTIVSMPNLGDLQLPKSGFESNGGLETALRKSSTNLRILARIDNIIYKHENPSAALSSYPDPELAADTPPLPPYLKDSIPISSMHKSITTAEIYALGGGLGRGRIHLMKCQGASGLTIDASAQPLADVVIISTCTIKFSGGSKIENARIISKSTAADSINSPSGLHLGRDDNCAVGGGAQLLTLGSMKFPSDLHIYGSQLMAKGDISFTANADAIQGASLIAGGSISGTSNMNMGLCLNGMEDNLEISYFRLAR